MTKKNFRAARRTLLFALCFGVSACESSRARQEAVQFAYSWEQTIKALGLFNMSDLREVENQSRSIEPTRNAIRAEGSEAMWREAQQLDTLILYVARSLNENIKANVARSEGSSAAKPVPVEFPDPALNALLGLNVNGGEDGPQKAISALHEAIVRFARVVGVEKDFLGAMQRREQADASNDGSKASAVTVPWSQIREGKIRAASEKKAFHAKECDLAEKEAMALKAPLGFAGAKWRMYPDEVKSVRPNAAMDADGNLSESMEWLGRPVAIKYSFDKVFDEMPSAEILVNGVPSFLVTVTVTFQGTATEAEFSKTQGFLQSAHGKMPAPNKTEEYVLVSHYKQGRISIWHRLRSNNVEEVVFGRETNRF